MVFTTRASSQDVRTARLIFLLGLVVTAGAGVLQALTHLGFMNGDGVSYLDIGDAVLNGELSAVFNGYWSPLYGILAASAERLGALVGLPSFAGVKFLNLAAYFLNLLFYLALVNRLLELPSLSNIESVCRLSFQLFALGLFSLTVLKCCPVWLVSPDLCMSAILLAVFVRGIAALDSGLSIRDAVGVGILLGLGYWLKAIVFPIAVAWFLIFALFWCRRTRHVQRFGLAVAVWAFTVAPLVVGVSMRVGHATFSDTGRLNYLWYVNRLPNRLWTGAQAGHGAPVHPLRQTHADPPIFEFAEAMPAATYPLWYDPSYWYSGSRIQLDVREQLNTVWDNLKSQRRMWLNRFMLPFLFFAAGGVCVAFTSLLRPGPALLLCFSCFPFFMLIPIHTEPRFFTAPVLTVLTLTSLSAASSQLSQRFRRSLILLLGVLAVFGWTATYSEVIGPSESPDPAPILETSRALRALGVVPGDQICVIADAAGVANHARLARVRIVGQMPLGAYRDYLSRRPDLPDGVFAAFRNAGCKAVLADFLPRDPIPPGWTSIPNSAARIHLLIARNARAE